MNLSINKTRNGNNNNNITNSLLLNNMVYSNKKQENGADPSKNIIEFTLDNKKSRNNNDTAFKKPSDFLAKTNIYVKKSIDSKNKQNERQSKNNKQFDIMRTQKLIYSNGNKNNHTTNPLSFSVKKEVPPRLNSTSNQVKQNPLAGLTAGHSNGNLSAGKKVVYVEKKEINLQKSGNTSKSNITSQNETSLTKSIITQSKQSTIKSSSLAQEKSFKAQGIDMYKYISSLLQKKISNNSGQHKETGKSPVKRNNKQTSNSLNNKFNSFYVNRGSNPKKNQQISFEVNLNSNQKKLNDDLSSNKKSRNTANTLGKHNSDKTPSIKSISFYIQNKRHAAAKASRSFVKPSKDDKSLVKSTSKQIEKLLVENSFLKQSANPLRNSKVSNPASQHSNGKDCIVTSK